MRTAYRALAYLIGLLIVVQAAAMAYTISGLFDWVANDGGVLDLATLESDSFDFNGIVGFIVHGMNGMFVIPVLAIALLVVSFFAHVPKGVMWAGVTVALVAAQVLLGISRVPELALLHGINALVLFAIVVVAARAASSTTVRSSAASVGTADVS